MASKLAIKSHTAKEIAILMTLWRHFRSETPQTSRAVSAKRHGETAIKGRR